MTFDGLFSKDEIRELVIEVATELNPTKPPSTILVVGGALLAWHGLRLSTKDVDSSVRLDDDLKSAVRVVAKRHQLASTWLNDYAAPWHPRTLQLEECQVLLEHPHLKVLGAPLAAVFLMKLNRSLPHDVSDMIALWPLVAQTFPTARSATDAFYAAFPLEAVDEFLGPQVANVALRAGQTLPLE